MVFVPTGLSSCIWRENVWVKTSKCIQIKKKKKKNQWKTPLRLTLFLNLFQRFDDDAVMSPYNCMLWIWSCWCDRDRSMFLIHCQIDSWQVMLLVLLLVIQFRISLQQWTHGKVFSKPMIVLALRMLALFALEHVTVYSPSKIDTKVITLWDSSGHPP